MDEEAIVQKCKEGDLMAYRLLYERYEQPFLRTAFRVLGRQQDSEDAVQETFLRLHRGIHHYKSGSKFSTYFFRILFNSCYDILRKRGPKHSDDFDMVDLSHSSSTELRQSIDQAIALLPDQMRNCFSLFAVEQFKQDEIAQILGVSVGTVKASIHRARIKLRTWLSDSRKEATG
jgi:RNA polymerase sigma-70 factor (ECF subfamily)